MSVEAGGFDDLVAAVRDFSEERGWTPVQTPKNLAMALTGEAGELAAELQWLGSDESVDAVRTDRELRERVAMEMADVLIYLARLADVTGIDLLDAARRKLAVNHGRFPVGSAPSRAHDG
ncbi:NTP pyrophosphatase (non-canonical NTP hydrolase) [Flavimobilis soli]|uniref:NTP pyrophosphatase (Non-canonical NTP hydrolase) n=1 Tax=Flavimobilis soli TaxID=442709 RepID=A0A2A9EAJ6_9MICO|nr:nucleotide pyrophosphohydrolase [Flavimobilis soli]PFG35843.1 NTP pyrophosphatase (non-canonical NTP hydrolase) [Flavimobilis soli]